MRSALAAIACKFDRCAAMQDYVLYDEIGRGSESQVFKGRKSV